MVSAFTSNIEEAFISFDGSRYIPSYMCLQFLCAALVDDDNSIPTSEGAIKWHHVRVSG